MNDAFTKYCIGSMKWHHTLHRYEMHADSDLSNNKSRMFTYRSVSSVVQDETSSTDHEVKHLCRDSDAMKTCSGMPLKIARAKKKNHCSASVIMCVLGAHRMCA